MRCFGLSLVVLLLPGWLYAQQVVVPVEPTDDDTSRDDFFIDEDYIEPKWHENRAQLPAPPAAAALVEIQDEADHEFRYLVDSRSLRLGDDRVTRLSLISRSASGFDNVEYIGIHCINERSKAYAYLGQDGQWRSYRNQDWRRVRAFDGILRRLTEFYLCDDLQALPPAVALRRMGGDHEARIGTNLDDLAE